MKYSIAGTLFRSLILILCLFLVSCPNPSGVNPEDLEETGGTGETDEGFVAGDVPEFFWGRWVRLDGGNEEWYISDSISTVNGIDYSVTVVSKEELTASGYQVTRQTSNMLSVEDDSVSFYLFRKTGANATVKSGVNDGDYGAVLSARGFSGLAGIEVILSNQENPANEIKTKTDDEGNLLFDGVIPGDDYTLTVPPQTGVDEALQVDITPEFDGKDVGSITLT